MPSGLPRFRLTRSPKLDKETGDGHTAPVPSPEADYATSSETDANNSSDTPASSGNASLSSRPPTSRRLLEWIQRLHTEPQAEAEAVDERRARLLEELSRAVAEASDDRPIGEVIRGLNRHADD